jgi:hypothetical protein
MQESLILNRLNPVMNELLSEKLYDVLVALIMIREETLAEAGL